MSTCNQKYKWGVNLDHLSNEMFEELLIHAGLCQQCDELLMKYEDSFLPALRAALPDMIVIPPAPIRVSPVHAFFDSAQRALVSVANYFSELWKLTARNLLLRGRYVASFGIVVIAVMIGLTTMYARNGGFRCMNDFTPEFTRHLINWIQVENDDRQELIADIPTEEIPVKFVAPVHLKFNALPELNRSDSPTINPVTEFTVTTTVNEMEIPVNESENHDSSTTNKDKPDGETTAAKDPFAKNPHKPASADKAKPNKRTALVTLQMVNISESELKNITCRWQLKKGNNVVIYSDHVCQWELGTFESYKITIENPMFKPKTIDIFVMDAPKTIPVELERKEKVD